jgi:hypothetical protein
MVVPPLPSTGRGAARASALTTHKPGRASQVVRAALRRIDRAGVPTVRGY